MGTSGKSEGPSIYEHQYSERETGEVVKVSLYAKGKGRRRQVGRGHRAKVGRGHRE